MPGQFSRKILFHKKMSSGRNPRPSRESGFRRETVGFDGTSPHISTDVKGLASSDPLNEEEWPPLSVNNASDSKGKRRNKIDLGTQIERRLEEKPREIVSSQHEASSLTNLRSKEQKTFLPTSFGDNRLPPIKRHKFRPVHPGYSVGARKTDSATDLPKLIPFDICRYKVGRSSTMGASLNAKNNEEQIELEQSTESTRQVLRPGMVLLRNYITHIEQVQIVKRCRDLGLGPGGFYQPSYRDGAKLRLQMMCLGLDWDPETRKYDKQRAFDGSEAPAIPHEFSTLVRRAIQDSRALVGKTGVLNAEDILPDMSPDICIVNFYTTSGRLGLHQDRDESKESLHKGLPVVSFSIGDSAEFLYGEQRDADKAGEVQLNSGDVLIFGGQSRHIFHGVPSIFPNSAPPALLEETNLRPGRLNLTFRQY